ncbi:hypothetical protein AB5J62_04315 [Amycolatopsis sp. cg5]|uniref:hypothetical protein n=1 Tax=Amycolatopsis sp. cg5 TaxID=3238802 RepID=UPI003523924C
MRKTIAALLLAAAALTGSVTPASATTDTVSAGCKTAKDSQENDGIIVTVWFTTFNGECYADRLNTGQTNQGRYGHFNLFGPDGFNRNSGTQQWGTGNGYNEYPRFKTWPGDLWCSRFYDGNNNPVTRPVCVTV